MFGILAVLVPAILVHPYIGALAWVWFGVMNPHRLSWGAAHDFPFSLVIAILTLIGVIFTREHRKAKGGMPAVMLLIFFAWICFTALFPFNPVEANAYLERVIKVYLMIGVILMLLHTRQQVEMLIWILVISLGFYGVKGGIFTIVGGGEYMVNGPDGSVIEGNNSIAVGLVIVVPLMVHLYQQARSRFVRLGLVAAALLCCVSVLGSYSRGALVAVFAMFLLLWLRSPKKLGVLMVFVAFVAVAIPAMPERWMTRMETTKTFEQDSSAMGRIIAWQTAYNIAKDRFPIGGGLEWNSRETYLRYSPVPEQTDLVAHSIYFQVLGSQGFIGLGLFLAFWILVWRQCSWLRRNTRPHPELRWAFSLASMAQVSLAGYAVGGAFLDLAFWDVPYYLYTAIGIAHYIVRKELASLAEGADRVGSVTRLQQSGRAASYRTG